MTVGQSVIVAFVFGQAVAVHLGQEAEMIGQREVPDLKLAPADAASPRADGLLKVKTAAMDAGRQACVERRPRHAGSGS